MKIYSISIKLHALFLFALIVCIEMSCKKDKAPSPPFFLFQFFNNTASGLPGHIIYDIVADQNNNIWVIIPDTGVAKFNGKEWTLYNSKNTSLNLESSNMLIVDKSNRLWVATNAGLVCYSNNSWTVYNSANSPLTSNQVSNVCADYNGTIWISTDDSSCHLAKFDGANWKIYSDSIWRNISINSRCMAIDKYNRLWIGYLQYRNLETSSTGYLITFDGISFDTMYRADFTYFRLLKEDNKGNIWVFGESRWPESIPRRWSKVFNENNLQENTSIPPPVGLRISWSDASCITFNDTAAWASGAGIYSSIRTEPKGIAYLSNNNWQLITNSNSNLQNPDVLCLTTDRNNKIWAGTTNGLIKLK